MGRTDRRRAWQRLVDRKLRVQLRLFLAIFAVMTAVVAYHLVRDGVSPLWAPVGFLPGLALGLVLCRTKVLRWEPDVRTVVEVTDLIGAVILVAYLAFIFFLRERIIGLAVEDAAAVGVVGLAMTAGAMLGRVYFTLRGIRNVLVEAGIRPVRRG
jgi:hypothetical protein